MLSNESTNVVTSNDNELITVIVPVYNAENNLEKCMRSILSQTYKNIEVILVDDGSGDRTPQMCDYYAKTDNRVKVIHKKNEGVSIARNTALSVATGKYISFVDSDDWLEEKALEILYNAITADNSDYVMASYNYVTYKNKIMPNKLESKTLSTEEFTDNLTDWYGNYNSPWGKLYRLSIIHNNKLMFPVNVSFGEDAIFSLKYIQNTNKVSIIDNIIYNYNIANEQSATKKFHPDFDKYIFNICNETKQTMRFDISSTEGKKQKFFSYVGWACKYTILHYLKYMRDNNALESKIKEILDRFFSLITVNDLLEFDKNFTKKEKRMIAEKNIHGLVIALKSDIIFKSVFNKLKSIKNKMKTLINK